MSVPVVRAYNSASQTDPCFAAVLLSFRLLKTAGLMQLSLTIIMHDWFNQWTSIKLSSDGPRVVSWQPIILLFAVIGQSGDGVEVIERGFPEGLKSLEKVIIVMMGW